MGKGDKRSTKGKRFSHSYGNMRPQNGDKKKVVAADKKKSNA